MKYPIAYYQIKKIRDFWKKSNSIHKDDMIVIFDEKLKEIEEEMILDELLELVS
jgi:hypothetical protein